MNALQAKPEHRYPILHIESFCPFSRRALLAACELEFNASIDQARCGAPPAFWSDLDPSGSAPLLEISQDTVIGGATPIGEYMEESLFADELGSRYRRDVSGPNTREKNALRLFPGSARQRAEIRRLVQWFDERFALDVTLPYLQEKFRRRFMARRDSRAAASHTPDVALLRDCLSALRMHQDYFESLLSRDDRHWFAGEELSMADLAAAAHLSCLDYFSAVTWGGHLKTWYQRIKSRRTFRYFLEERIPGIPPARFYDSLDF